MSGFPILNIWIRSLLLHIPGQRITRKLPVAAIREMMKAAGTCAYDEDGYIQKGVIVRHLILPGHTKNSIAVLDELYGTYGDESDHQPDEPVHTASAGT